MEIMTAGDAGSGFELVQSRRPPVVLLDLVLPGVKELVAKKKFREDLYYRLAMLQLELSRLSHRREDLTSAAASFIGCWES